MDHSAQHARIYRPINVLLLIVLPNLAIGMDGGRRASSSRVCQGFDELVCYLDMIATLEDYISVALSSGFINS